MSLWDWVQGMKTVKVIPGCTSNRNQFKKKATKHELALGHYFLFCR